MDSLATGRERAADVGHRDVGDGTVERLLEGGQRHRDGDDPWIGAGTPSVGFEPFGRQSEQSILVPSELAINAHQKYSSETPQNPESGLCPAGSREIMMSFIPF
jgi:hypothetical protein